MADLIAASVAVSFGVRPLFSNVSLSLDPGDRVALVGPNGAGKTTLLRVLAGTQPPTEGEVTRPEHVVVSLHDQRPARGAQSLRDHVAPDRMVAAEARLRELEAEMASGDEAVLAEWERLRTRFDAAGGETWRVRVDEVLRGLGFTERQLDQPLDTLSGGELTRASLARALATDPDVLLLDEPTNHLDIATIDWLQEHLGTLRGAVVLVSHDRWFIESTCTSVVEVSHGRARRFQGSFVEYRAQQAVEAATHQREVERWQGEVARLQRFVDRFGAGTRARQAQSRAKVLDKLREDVPAYADLSQRRALSFSLPKVQVEPGRVVFETRGLELAVPAAEGRERRELVRGETDIAIERGEKVALLGPNGAGKSTFLHELAAEAVPLVKPSGLRERGEVRVGYDVKARLLSQHDVELADDASMVANVQRATPSLDGTRARALLGLFGFTGDDGERLVGSLSGGERRRVLLAMALGGSDNVLLLDEPTNHLDIEGREALEAALAEYGGTVLLISHDRALVEGVATRTVLLHDGELVTCPGGYDEARAVLVGDAEAPRADAARAAAEAVDEARARRAGSGGPGASAGTGARRSRRRGRGGSGRGAATTGGSGATEAGSRPAPAATKPDESSPGRGRKVRRRRDGSVKVRAQAVIEREIEQLEGEQARIDELMLDPDVYTDPEKSSAALAEHGRVARDLAARWQELEQALEQQDA